MKFTQEELDEMAAFDAMIDAEPDELTDEEEAAARHVDQVAFDSMKSWTRSRAKHNTQRYKPLTPEKRAKYNAHRKAKREKAVPDECLKAFRVGTGLSQAQFAKACGVNYYTYIQWEHGIYRAKDNIIGNTFQIFWKFRDEWERNNK